MMRPEMQRIIRTWWPLAASWMLMAAELPALSAVMARLPNPAINLAAYGGVVFPLALIIESPILMLLSASTALSKDWASYRKIWRFMMATSAVMTGLHLLLVFTPLYYVVVRGILGVPEVIVEPARIGLMIMTPWTWAIAYRRYHQGVLIRFGHFKAVGAGTVMRLSANGLVLLIGYSLGTLSGIVVATSAVIAGVISEAIFIGLAVRPVLRDDVKPAPPVVPPLIWRAFCVLHPIGVDIVHQLGCATDRQAPGLSRMPDPIASLAVWPVVTGLLFLIRSLGFALNEVVVGAAGSARHGVQPAPVHRDPGRFTNGLLAPLRHDAPLRGVVRPHFGAAAAPGRAGAHRPLADAAHPGIDRAAELVPGFDCQQPAHAWRH